ncbi:hypothetical protein H072_3607 [Dactylellina haptotyla CBS 200.50]|uniref:Uncharacterized protein n=1 Tax=Dactylellina haptotyla (strain CBS 200.50) TaxID=1284197 RepID=S8AHX0_DACHA|nr:hypothetical protein H072_3607 [Dactylellina haptotyla CBS 200.50]
MFVDIAASISTSPALPVQTAESSSLPPLPPYRPTNKPTLTTKFELSYSPLSESNPTIPIYRTKNSLPTESDVAPPEYEPTLASPDVKPAYFLRHDARTQGSFITSSEGIDVALVYFLKPTVPTVTIFDTSNLAAKLENLEAIEGHAITLNEDATEDPEDPTGAGDEDTDSTFTTPSDASASSPKETITLTSRKFFGSRGTSFTPTSTPYQFKWNKSLVSTMPRNPSANASLSNELILTRSFLKNKKEGSIMPYEGNRGKTVGRVGVHIYDPSRLVLEMDESQEGLSEALFLGTAIAMLKKSDIKTAKKISSKRNSLGWTVSLMSASRTGM